MPSLGLTYNASLSLQSPSRQNLMNWTRFSPQVWCSCPLHAQQKNDTLKLSFLGDAGLRRPPAFSARGKQSMGTDPPGEQVNGSGTAGVIGRPILLFPAAVLVGLALDRLLPSPFAVLGIDLWSTGSSAAR